MNFINIKLRLLIDCRLVEVEVEVVILDSTEFRTSRLIQITGANACNRLISKERNLFESIMSI